MNFFAMTSIILVTTFQTAAFACLPPPKAYTDQEAIKAVVDSSALSQTMSEVTSLIFDAGILSISRPKNQTDSVKVTFSKKCSAVFKVTWVNVDPEAPCGSGFKPNIIERTAFNCKD